MNNDIEKQLIEKMQKEYLFDENELKDQLDENCDTIEKKVQELLGEKYEDKVNAP